MLYGTIGPSSWVDFPLTPCQNGQAALYESRQAGVNAISVSWDSLESGAWI